MNTVNTVALGKASEQRWIRAREPVDGLIWITYGKESDTGPQTETQDHPVQGVS